MQSFKQGMWKGYNLSVEGIRKGYLFCKKWCIKGWGVGPPRGASKCKTLLSSPPLYPPPSPRRDLLSDNSLVLLQFLRSKNATSCHRIVNLSPLSKISTFMLLKDMWRVSKNDYCPQQRSFIPLQITLAACAVVHQQSSPTSYILASTDCIIADNRLIIGQALINSL